MKLTTKPWCRETIAPAESLAGLSAAYIGNDCRLPSSNTFDLIPPGAGVEDYRARQFGQVDQGG
jgi:hypothetical protein